MAFIRDLLRPRGMMAFILACALCLSFSCVAFASSTPSASVVGPSDYASILTAMTAQVSVSTIVGVLAAAVTASIGLVFLWWGVRKLMATFFSAFRKGKASV